jgi:hypothetical protein
VVAVVVTQAGDVRGVVVAGAALVICCVCVALMTRSRRPDGKMAFLLWLISAAQQPPHNSAIPPHVDGTR